MYSKLFNVERFPGPGRAKKFVRIALALAIAWQAGLPLNRAGASPQASACPTPTRIMPLGDSITQGASSGEDDLTKQVGYRKYLWESLVAAGYNVDFVGSQTNGQFYQPDGFDPNHEGHPGWRDDQVALNIYDNGGANWLSQNPADVILLHIGTNGLTPSTTDANDVENILNEIDQYEVANNVEITVVLALIINRLTFPSLTTTFNNNVKSMAQARIANGDKIVIVDMENGAGLVYQEQPAGDMFNDLHPYTTGYQKMAAVWFNALANILPICDPAPHITSTAVTSGVKGQPYSYDVNASGSPAPTYSFVGTPPPGMTINSSTGLISWTPPAAGNYNVTVKASNSAGDDMQSFTIAVASMPQINSAPVTSAKMGQPYSYDVNASGDPAPTYSFIGTPPTGMTINSSTGLISWTPPATGTYSVTVQASNSAGAASQPFNITVTEGGSFILYIPAILVNQ